MTNAFSNSAASPPFSPQALDTMEPGELRAWLFDLLHGRHSIPIAPHAASPATLLLSLLGDCLNRTCTVVEHALIGFLRRLVDYPESEWRSSAGLELIRVLPHVLYDERREQAWNLLLRVAADPRRYADGPVNRHLAALQALLDLCYRSPYVENRLDIRFWQDQSTAEFDRQQYLTTIFEGMARADIDAAIEWLVERGSTAEVAHAFSYLLPSLGRLPKFLTAIEAAEVRLPDQCQKTLRRFRTLLGRRQALEEREIDENVVSHIHKVANVRANSEFVEAGWLESLWAPGSENEICDEILMIAGVK